MEQVSLEDRQVFDRAAARLVLAWSRSGLTINEVSELSTRSSMSIGGTTARANLI